MKKGCFEVIIPEGRETSDGYVALQHATPYTVMLTNHSTARCDAEVMLDGRKVGVWRVGAGKGFVVERPIHDSGRFTFFVQGTKEAKAAGLVTSDDLGRVSVKFMPEHIAIPAYLQGMAVPSVEKLLTGKCDWEIEPEQVDESGTDVEDEDSDLRDQPEKSEEEKALGSKNLDFGSSSDKVNSPAALDGEGKEKPLVLFMAAPSFSAPSQRLAGGTGLSGHSGQSFSDAEDIVRDPGGEVSIHLRLVALDHAPRPLFGKETGVPPQQRAAATIPPKTSKAVPVKRKTDFLTIAAWVICVPAGAFLIAFITQLQSPNSSASQKSNDKIAVIEQPFSPGAATSLEENPKDAAEAMKWYRKATEQGDAEAQYLLGLCYERGFGVPKDAAEAMKWYRKSAEQGDDDSQFSLGLGYESGQGVPKDAGEAMKWYRKSAEQGHAGAQCLLGYGYKDGNGVVKDEIESALWFQRAAVQGEDEAQSSLGTCYVNGNGVTKNKILAHMWLNLASAHGEEKAKKNLLILEAQMTSQQIAEAEKLAANFKPTMESAPLQPSPLTETGSLPSKSTNQTLRPYDQSWNDAFDASEARAFRKYPALTDESSELYASVSARCVELVALKDSGLMLPFAMIDGSFVKIDPGNPDFPYLVACEQSAKLAIRSTSKAAATKNGELDKIPLPTPPPIEKAATATVPPKAVYDGIGWPWHPKDKGTVDPMLRHLSSDERLASGSILTDQLKTLSGKGTLTLDNGLTEDAYVKMIHNEKLAASFYVRGGERFTFDHVPDGVYKLIYCTGFGWDSGRRDFARGRHAVRYDASLDFLTTKQKEGSKIITSTSVITLTLHTVANGNARTSGISLEEFDRY